MGVKYIIHCADIHIRTYRLHEEYRDGFEIFFNDIKSQINGLKRDEIRIALCGDLVHQKINTSNELFVLCRWFLSELSKIAPLIIIAGNHDLLENNKDRLDTITPIVDSIGSSDIKYLKKSECVLDDNIVWCPYSIFEDNKRPNIDKAREEYGSDKKYVGLYHAPINNSKTDTGYIFNEIVGYEIFDGCDFVLLGDIHKRQSFEYNGIKMAYPGSLFQQNFGENINKHGYLIWDVNKCDFIERDIKTDYGYYTFNIKSIKDIEMGNEKLLNY